MVRTPCCDKTGLKKGPWTPEEDDHLMSYIRQHGHGNWRALPKQAGLLRCGKSCRLRWTNYLRPDIKRGNFTRDEEDAIINLHQQLGNKWSAIAARLPGRTDNEIKNVWHTHLKKRLTPEEGEGRPAEDPHQQQQSRRRSKKEAATTMIMPSILLLPEEPTPTESWGEGAPSYSAAAEYSSMATSEANNDDGQFPADIPELDDSFWSEELTSIASSSSSSSRSTDIDFINHFEEAILSGASFPDGEEDGGNGVMGFWLRALQK